MDCFGFFFKLETNDNWVKAHWGKRLTLAGQARRLVAGLAHAVLDGGAAGPGGVLHIGAGQAGPRAPRRPLRFVGAGWTCCGGHGGKIILMKGEKTWTVDIVP